MDVSTERCVVEIEPYFGGDSLQQELERFHSRSLAILGTVTSCVFMSIPWR